MSEMFAIYFIITLLVSENLFVQADEWKYNDEGHWSPLCKEGKRQSPIALLRDIAEEKEYTTIIFDGYNKIYPATIQNNGHSAEIKLQSNIEERPEVKGGSLPEIYVLDHLHFHWQSEHIIEGYRFPLELHLVHYAKVHGNLTVAKNHPNGIAVFAILFDLSPDDDRDFQPLVNILQQLKHQVKSPFQFDNLIVERFLPRDTAGYYRYEGSLTTPNCNEVVVWTVMTNTLPISKQQVKAFEQLTTNGKQPLPKNYRSLQDINGRYVYLRVSPIRSSSDVVRSIASNVLTMIVGVILFYSN